MYDYYATLNFSKNRVQLISNSTVHIGKSACIEIMGARQVGLHAFMERDKIRVVYVIGREEIDHAKTATDLFKV